MTVRRADLADADAMQSALEGQAMFERGDPLPAAEAAGPWHKRGWLSAAGEAQRTLRAYAPVLRNIAGIKRAIEQSGAAVRALAPVKIRPAQRNLRDAALADVNFALAILQTAESAADDAHRAHLERMRSRPS